MEKPVVCHEPWHVVVVVIDLTAAGVVADVGIGDVGAYGISVWANENRLE